MADEPDRVRLAEQETITGRADFAPGSTADPMGFDDVAEKFRDCADYAGWPVAVGASRSLAEVWPEESE